jgi:hypothetical protein
MVSPDPRPNGPPRAPNRRPIVDELGQFHPSCMHAAEARGVSVALAYSRARFNKAGWRFATPHEIALGASSPATVG